MKVLYRVEEIREAIRDVLCDASSDRYAFVAFVGKNPLSWLPDPKGMRVFCWPRAGGTNPDGIDELVNAEVTVYFMESMHSKVYHSERRGTVIGSANLTNNALGTGRLTETVVKLPAGVFSIDEQMTSLRGAVKSGTPAFTVMMDKLRNEHVAYYQRNPAKLTGPAAPREQMTFGEWAERRKDSRAPWQLGLWSESDGPPQDAVDEFQRTDTTQYSNWRAHASQNNIVVGVATLDCQSDKYNRGISKKSAKWWYPEAIHLSNDPDWVDTPHVWFARVDVPSGVTVPFDCTEHRFLDALSKAVARFAGKIDELAGPVNDEFINLLVAQYGASKARRSLRSDVLEGIFQICQQVDRGEITLGQGVHELVRAYRLNRSSANATIRSVRHMLNGETYRRTLTLQVTRYVLTRINEEYGPIGLQEATRALRAHIQYLNSVNTNSPGLRMVLDNFTQQGVAP